MGSGNKHLKTMSVIDEDDIRTLCLTVQHPAIIQTLSCSPDRRGRQPCALRKIFRRGEAEGVIRQRRFVT
jgi:hypothetical protein